QARRQRGRDDRRVKKSAIVVVGLLGLGLAGTRFLGSAGDPPPAETSVFAAKRGMLPITLIETGTLNTKNASNVRADVEGSAKIAWLVDEGATVKSGDVLVELDKTDCKKRIEELVNQRIQAES